MSLTRKGSSFYLAGIAVARIDVLGRGWSRQYVAMAPVDIGAFRSDALADAAIRRYLTPSAVPSVGA